jgi:hypothetical protein
MSIFGVSLKDVLILLTLIIISIPIFKKVFYLFFDDMSDFNSHFIMYRKSDAKSFSEGRYLEDKASEITLGLFSVICIAIILVEVFLVKAIIGIFN